MQFVGHKRTVEIRSLGRQKYEPLWRSMQAFTNSRSDKTPDEIWFTDHPPIFTLGLNASHEHVLTPGDIPVIQIDRGGEVTYHGPGQLMIYALIDLKRAKLDVRNLVTALEQSVIALTAQYGIKAASSANAPGVYVQGKKIASVGLRVRRNSSYHGMALNVAMDLEPFTRINTCGFSNLKVTDLTELGMTKDLSEVLKDLEPHLLKHLGL
jgi:lipoyl(octanoyl) transferase